MNNELTNNFDVVEGMEIEANELESIAAALPVRTNVRAGAVKNCCGRNCCS